MSTSQLIQRPSRLYRISILHIHVLLCFKPSLRSLLLLNTGSLLLTLLGNSSLRRLLGNLSFTRHQNLILSLSIQLILNRLGIKAILSLNHWLFSSVLRLRFTFRCNRSLIRSNNCFLFRLSYWVNNWSHRQFLLLILLLGRSNSRRGLDLGSWGLSLRRSRCGLGSWLASL